MKAIEEERQLPEISILGHPWLVDGANCELIDKENPEKRISAFEMEYSPEGYRVSYSKSLRTLVPGPPWDLNDILFVHLFHFKTMDPEGVAKKYGMPVSELKGKTDYDIMTDRRHLFTFRDPQYHARIYRNGENAAVYCIAKAPQDLSDLIEKKRQSMAIIVASSKKSMGVNKVKQKRKGRGI